MYALGVLLNYEDALKEGDADREQLCLRFFVIFLHNMGSYRYSDCHYCTVLSHASRQGSKGIPVGRKVVCERDCKC